MGCHSYELPGREDPELDCGSFASNDFEGSTEALGGDCTRRHRLQHRRRKEKQNLEKRMATETEQRKVSVQWAAARDGQR
ncbi:hypothetical protein U1Q18_047705 [Sarracenia purpurea var. burkii]